MESAGSVRPRDDGDDASVSGNSAKRARGLGSGGRGAGYSPPEVSFFLSLLEEHLPVTNREWKAVVRLHNQQFPSLKRTPNSLRRKFSSLCRSIGSADEATMAPEVRRALHAKRRMKNRGDVPEGDDVPDSDEDDNDQEDEGMSTMNGNQRRLSANESSALAQSTAPLYYAATAAAQATPMVVPAPTMPMQMAPPPQQPHYNGNGVQHTQALYERVVNTSDRRSPTSDADLIELIKMQLLQNMEDDRRRRAEDQERREEERRHREEERAMREEFRRRYEEERARREQDLRRWETERDESRRRHEEFMQLILSLVSKHKSS